MKTPFFPIALCALLLGACGPSPDGDGRQGPLSSNRLMPAADAIKTLYIQSCYGCHSSGAGNAPRTGVTTDWNTRWQQGMETLLDNTKNGMRNMPAKGMCMNCSDEEFEALIRFMAGRE